MASRSLQLGCSGDCACSFENLRSEIAIDRNAADAVVPFEAAER
jgi:hypothetical protein